MAGALASNGTSKPTPPDKRMAAVPTVFGPEFISTRALTGRTLWLRRYESGKHLAAAQAIITFARANALLCLTGA